MRGIKKFRYAFVIAVGDKSPFAKKALLIVDAVSECLRQVADKLDELERREGEKE